MNKSATIDRFVGIASLILLGIGTYYGAALYYRDVPDSAVKQSAIHTAPIMMPPPWWVLALLGVGIALLLTSWGSAFIKWILKRKVPLSKVANVTFRNELVNLDGKYFLNCNFENTTFRFSGGRFHMKGVHIIGFRTVEIKSLAGFGTIELLKICGFLTEEFRDNWSSLPLEHFE